MAFGLLVVVAAVLTSFGFTAALLAGVKNSNLNREECLTLLGELAAATLSFLVFVGMVTLLVKVLLRSGKAARVVIALAVLGALFLPLMHVLYQARIDKLQTTLWNAHYLSPIVMFLDSWFRWYHEGDNPFLLTIHGQPCPPVVIGSALYVAASLLGAVLAIALRFWLRVRGRVDGG